MNCPYISESSIFNKFRIPLKRNLDFNLILLQKTTFSGKLVKTNTLYASCMRIICVDSSNENEILSIKGATFYMVKFLT